MAELEGFICPLCKEDLKGISQLEEHFKHEHEEKRFSKLKSNLKHIFDKAKPKMMKKRADQKPTAAIVTQVATYPLSIGPAAIVSGIDPALWPPQEFGTAIDHILDFRKIRDAKLTREAMETNRLVIRVEKLFRLLRDGHSRKLKEIEKEMVPCKSDREEKSCVKCGKAFSLQRWKYLCLLCGNTICDGCSLFVSLSDIYPLLKDCPDYPTLTCLYQQPKKFSLLGNEDEDMRMCSSCRHHLSYRLQCMASEVKSLLTTYYEKMQLAIDEADSLKPAYLEVAESIMNGEYLHTLQDAQRRRGTLLQLYNSIDSISKQILAMGTAPPAASPECSLAPPLENLRLCRAIRSRATQYLQENLVTLSTLPSLEKLQNLRATKDGEAQERIREQQRKREDQRQQGAGVEVTTRALTVGKMGSSDRDAWTEVGWEDEQYGVGTPLMDPFVEQRGQLLSSIQQAKQYGVDQFMEQQGHSGVL